MCAAINYLIFFILIIVTVLILYQSYNKHINKRIFGSAGELNDLEPNALGIDLNKALAFNNFLDSDRVKSVDTPQSMIGKLGYQYAFFSKANAADWNINYEKLVQDSAIIETTMVDTIAYSYIGADGKEIVLSTSPFTRNFQIKKLIETGQIKSKADVKESLPISTPVYKNIYKPHQFNANNSAILYIILSNIIVGYVSGVLNEDNIIIGDVAVHPHYQRRGICTIMIKLFISLVPNKEIYKYFYLENTGGIQACKCYLRAFNVGENKYKLATEENYMAFNAFPPTDGVQLISSEHCTDSALDYHYNRDIYFLNSMQLKAVI